MLSWENVITVFLIPTRLAMEAVRDWQEKKSHGARKFSPLHAREVPLSQIHLEKKEPGF